MRLTRAVIVFESIFQSFNSFVPCQVILRSSFSCYLKLFVANFFDVLPMFGAWLYQVVPPGLRAQDCATRALRGQHSRRLDAFSLFSFDDYSCTLLTTFLDSLCLHSAHSCIFQISFVLKTLQMCILNSWL